MSVFDRFRRKSDEPDLSKAIAIPSAGSNGVMAVADAATLLQAATAGARGNGLQVTPSQPLTRDPLDLLTFGPGHPLFPQNIDPARPDSQRPEPRIYDFPVSVNLPGVTDRLIPWKVLRDAAQSIGLFRRCIEVRKNEIEGLDWDITVSRDAISLAMRNDPSKGRNDVEAELRDKLEPEIGRLRKFWQNPDPGNDYTLVEWTKQVLEEHFVLDAVAIYPRRTYGGQVWALECLDGSTIKPLLDHRGGRPLPPHPAFQQILQGFPRGEFIASTTADADGQTIIPNAYPADKLIYRRRNVRTHTPYGLSAVERALFDGDIWLRRLEWIKSEYTYGAMPPARIKNVQTSVAPEYMDPMKLQVYERALNDMMSGQTSERRLLKMLPPGWEVDGNETDAADQYKPDYDLFLIKLVAGHFDTVATEIGFSETGGLGSAGFHEGQSDINERAGTNPTLKWLQALYTDLTRRCLGGPPELEFKFLGLDSEDEAAEDAVWSDRVAGARATLNEDRDRIGAPRYDFPEADMPMLISDRGVVFIAGASENSIPGVMVGPPTTPPQQEDAEAGEDDDTDSAPPASGGAPAAKKTTPPAKTAAQAAKTTSKADELRALRAFVSKGDRGRQFVAEYLNKADVVQAGIDESRVLFKAGGASARGARRRTGGVDRVPALPVGDGDRQPLPYRAGT